MKTTIREVPKELGIEMISHISDDVWKNKNTTFLDISMQTGSLVVAIEEKLKSYGFSDENIKNRVFGFAENAYMLAYAINKYNLVGTYSVVNALKCNVDKTLGLRFNINNKEYNMKFDVVVGNPPYQGVSYTENKGGSQASTALWPKFSKKAFEISNDIVALITPKTILKSSFFKKELNSVYYLNIDECSKHFHVGSSFVYFISSYKGNYSKKVKFFDGSEKTVENFNFLKGHDVTGKADDVSLSIIAKLNKFEKILYKKGTAISINNVKFYTDKKSEKFPFECYYSSKEDRQKLFTKNKTEGYGVGNKLIVAHIFDFSEKNYDWFSTDKRNVGAGLQAGVLYFDKYDGENVRSYLLSGVVKFLNRFYRHGRYAYNVFRNLPKIDFSRKWTDKQLYKYFNLTQEQIDYIENI